MPPRGTGGEALQRGGRGLLDRADAIGVAAQQHGMVALDERRPRGAAGAALERHCARRRRRPGGGGPSSAARRHAPTRIGSVPTASSPSPSCAGWPTRARRAARTASVLLPHDWLTWQLAGAGRRRRADTDRGDASGTGYFSPAGDSWLPELAAWALGRAIRRSCRGWSARPRSPARPGRGRCCPRAPATTWPRRSGLGLADGDVVVSIGTSGTASRRRGSSADPRARWPASAMRPAASCHWPAPSTRPGCSRDRRPARRRPRQLARLALAARPGAGGLTLLPYLDGERTPNRPRGGRVVQRAHHVRGDPEDLARAAVEALLCSLADAIDAPYHFCVTPAPGAPDRRRRAPPPSAPTRADRCLGTAVVSPPPPSTSRSAPPARQHGRWPGTPGRRRGRARSLLTTRTAGPAGAREVRGAAGRRRAMTRARR